MADLVPTKILRSHDRPDSVETEKAKWPQDKRPQRFLKSGCKFRSLPPNCYLQFTSKAVKLNTKGQRKLKFVMENLANSGQT